MEYEFFNFREDPHSLVANKGSTLEHITPGMFGYSLTRPVQNQDFYYGVFNACMFLLSALILGELVERGSRHMFKYKN